jgi:hypothetical protein
MDSSNKVKFEWHNDTAIWPFDKLATAIADTSISTDGATISINLSHPKWQQIPLNERRDEFVGTLFHESTHVYLDRYCTNAALQGATGHGAAWQMVSEAIERHAAEILSASFHLGRATSLLYEHKTCGEIDLNQAELGSCFGDQFWYSELTNALFNMGWPLFGITDEQAETYEPNRPVHDRARCVSLQGGHVLE